MPKLPEPPGLEKLRNSQPDFIELAAGTLLWRLYFRAGLYPNTWSSLRFYGPTANRFDHHQTNPQRLAYEQERGIIYLATDALTCIAEVFQKSRLIDCNKSAPWLVAFELTESVRLLDLTGSWPTRAGASMALNSGPRARARRWSQAIYQAFPEISGLYYSSSMHANQSAVALYERVLQHNALPGHPRFHRALNDPVLLPALENAAATLGYALSVRW